MTIQTQYAGFWKRLVADLLDTALLTAASWFLELLILGAIYFVRAYAQSFTGAFSDAFNPFFLQVFNGILYVALAIPYYVWAHLRYGTTFGKRPLRIYVVNASDHQAISLKQSWIRCLSYAVSYAPLCAGFIMAAYQPEKRALHDLFAGTVSIIKSKPASVP